MHKILLRILAQHSCLWSNGVRIVNDFVTEHRKAKSLEALFNKYTGSQIISPVCGTQSPASPFFFNLIFLILCFLCRGCFSPGGPLIFRTSRRHNLQTPEAAAQTKHYHKTMLCAHKSATRIFNATNQTNGRRIYANSSRNLFETNFKFIKQNLFCKFLFHHWKHFEAVAPSAHRINYTPIINVKCSTTFGSPLEDLVTNILFYNLPVHHLQNGRFRVLRPGTSRLDDDDAYKPDILIAASWTELNMFPSVETWLRFPPIPLSIPLARTRHYATYYTYQFDGALLQL